MPASALDELLPVYDISDSVGVTVAADSESVWRSLLGVDLIEVGRRKPAVAALGAIRMLPELGVALLRRRKPPPRPERMSLDSLAGEGGDWVELARIEGEELVFGLVGKFWRPVIEYASVEREAFSDFAEPGFAKTVYALRVDSRGPGATFLSGTMRTATTDGAARRRFHRYWTFGVGSGAHVLVAGLLNVVAEDAERTGTTPLAGAPA
jgi:hypothetical protein